MKAWKTKVGYALAFGRYRLFFSNYWSPIQKYQYEDGIVDYELGHLIFRIKPKLSR